MLGNVSVVESMNYFVWELNGTLGLWLDIRHQSIKGSKLMLMQELPLFGKVKNVGLIM